MVANDASSGTVGEISRIIHDCQVCGADNLVPIISLGTMPPVNEMPEIGETKPVEMRFPLDLVRCTSCGLVQVSCEVNSAILFPKTYPYLSGSTGSLLKNFANLAEEAEKTLGLTKDDLVLDIGSNDGSLLSKFADLGIGVLGVEPTDACLNARANGIETINEFFTESLATSILADRGVVSLITAANVFAHINDVNAVLRGIVSLIGGDGVFISESHYLQSVLTELQYDTIYHEHLRYYSLTSLATLFEQHGLSIFKVVRIPSHGGSIRVYASASDRFSRDASVDDMFQEEQRLGLADGRLDNVFADRVRENKLALVEMLAKIKLKGNRIVGIGAPSRASTLLNYTGIDESYLDAVLELPSSKKIGKFMPGTSIPVIDERHLFEQQPEYALLLSWHIAEELCHALRCKGFAGKFIQPLPSPCIIE